MTRDACRTTPQGHVIEEGLEAYAIENTHGLVIPASAYLQFAGDQDTGRAEAGQARHLPGGRRALPGPAAQQDP